MPENQQPSHRGTPEELDSLAGQVNEALKRYSDKDWNYSRIFLITKPLDQIDGPFVLWIEKVNDRTKEGQRELKTVSSEVTWGDRHSSELGILEIISLRLNKALQETATDDYWAHSRPIIRLVKKELLAQQGITVALWYQVREVSGEDFDSR